jgi:hypothetical protein
MRRLLVGIAFAGAVALAGASALAAPPPSTLMGEHLTGGSVRGGVAQVFGGQCQDGTPNQSPSPWTFTASGTAAGPYPGTFTESGTVSFSALGTADFTATFTIVSGDITVTGSKQGSGLAGSCYNLPGVVFTFDVFGTTSYQATIRTPTGAYTDSGNASGDLFQDINSATRRAYSIFDENFLQSNGLKPTTKDQCKDGGWAALGFSNQGQCIKYVNKH